MTSYFESISQRQDAGKGIKVTSACTQKCIAKIYILRKKLSIDF